jgi:DNA-binding MarR family transcriptional regulator
VFSFALRHQDSNLDKQLQRLWCCHYTMAESGLIVTTSAQVQVCQITQGNNGDVNAIPEDSNQDARDEVDRIVFAWQSERPDLDFTPLQVLSRVGRLARLLDRARRQAFSRSKLEAWEFDVLAALRRAGSPFQLSPKALLQQTLVSSGTMTNRIDKLVENGLVVRRDDPNDGRGVLVEMTSVGLTRVDAAITRLIDAEAGILSGLSRVEQKKLAESLRRLGLSLDEVSVED